MNIKQITRKSNFHKNGDIKKISRSVSPILSRGENLVQLTLLDHLYWAQISVAPNIKEYEEALLHLSKAKSLIKQLQKFNRK